MEKSILCPVCERHTFKQWDELCPVCNWCHSFLQENNAERKKCENIMSLNQAKEAFIKGEEIF